ncbi:hypothetical protein [Magnetospirillum sp. UT-4]|uniref:hypothetical protein n=1 Tax=Magnetospirillum sp. UT-4 TaxID=2681467 RepID=UPI00157268EB|nr:hypothetical protein [Magnetospirillum sp. UT-4]
MYKFMFAVVVLLLPAIAEAKPEAVVASCPKTWQFGPRSMPLTGALIWANFIRIDETTTIRAGRALSRMDIAQFDQRPVFLHCTYGKDWKSVVAVQLPEHTISCEIEWETTKRRDTEGVHTHYIRALSAECHGPAQGEPAQAFAVSPPSPATEVEALRLRRSAADLKQLVAARGGSWFQPAEGAPAEIGFGDTRLKVIFSLATGLSREIVLYGPPPAEGDHAFQSAVISRFGFPIKYDDVVCADVWSDTDEIAVEWRSPCSKQPNLPLQEMRLVDMADPESRRVRGKE